MPDTTDASRSSLPNSSPPSRSSSYFTYPVTYAVSGLLRRLSTEPTAKSTSNPDRSGTTSLSQSIQSIGSMDSVFQPPRRKASPFQPPPLTPLTLKGYRPNTQQSAKLLTKALAEEIRLLVPPRLQLVDEWNLAYSLEQNGVSLATLYQKSEDYRGKRGGFVLVVQDSSGGVFGAYLSDAPHPSPHFYGNGECFLWRAHTLPSLPDLIDLPPPPSADTTNAVRVTTVGATKPNTLSPPSSEQASRSGTSTPERIRFKAFPYSGVNDYMIFCEQDYLSIGGGDGHYGLWLDDSLENGVSSTCPTFGNEPLSDDGNKFEILGVELWYIGV
ncbi:TLD-domain-containing protein [Corynespora cassiicola Philippines]|uniref:Oxidation resistance protein 1 n=1 Tax=Corynespora cassiicola Philippines TaxID=1448308 RepID=A0A2T2NAT3_CORCC|nr:TLD-domain-containing protein [Corynespora cassiicola Philippines]